MLELGQMKQEEYDDYYRGALQHRADETAKARGVSWETIIETAKNSFETLLPGNRTTAPRRFRLLQRPAAALALPNQSSPNEKSGFFNTCS